MEEDTIENLEPTSSDEVATLSTVEDKKITAFDPQSDISNPKIMEIWVDNILRDAEVVGLEHKFFK